MNLTGQAAPRLSVAMMVKDEERYIGNALASIRDIADEVIIVDTGSKDRTLEIARSFGPIIFEDPWRGDFSYHRNQSIEKCSGDWIMILDADEELVLPPGYKLEEKLSQIPPECTAAALMLRNINGSDRTCRDIMSQVIQVRFFRKGTIRYEGAIHNQISVRPDAAILEGVDLNHYGYARDFDKRDEKFRRSQSMMFSALADNPDDHRLKFQLAELYADHGEDILALEWGDRYIKARPSLNGDFNPSVYFTLATCSLKIKSRDLARKYILEGSKAFPDYIDIWFAGVKYAIEIEDPMLALNTAHEYLKLYDRYNQDPRLAAEQFIFTAAPKFVAFAAYAIVHAGLTQAGQGLDVIANARPLLDDELRGAIEDQILAVVSRATLPGQTQIRPFAEVPNE